MINTTIYTCSDFSPSCVTVMDQIVRNLLVLAIACSFISCQEPSLPYNMRSITGTKAGLCPTTQGVVESIRQDIDSFINNSVLPSLRGYGACGCSSPGWKRAACLNMSDPTQTCPPAWELITAPRRSCTRPSNAGSCLCYSANTTDETYVIQLCSLLKALNALRSVEELLDMKLEHHKHFAALMMAALGLLMVHMLME